MDLSPSLQAKQFYRFTGPPENWLTAIKYGTWGMEDKNQLKWEKIQPGDVFFIHSSSASSVFKNARSGIIGIGVIGANFSRKDNSLWLYEQEQNVNRWPLLVPIAEFYLFSDMPSPESWEAPSPVSTLATPNLIDRLLERFIPLSHIKGFPQMGSFSRVSEDVTRQILDGSDRLHVVEPPQILIGTTAKNPHMEVITDAAESLRFASSLSLFTDIKKKMVNPGKSVFTRDNELLEKAEDAHLNALQQLLSMFKARGYKTMYSRNVDLFAHNNKKAFLIEVKSIENRNFRSQARKGIVQLLEYDYFDVEAFVREEEIEFEERNSVLVTTRVPKDMKYIGFVNSLKIGVGTVGENTLTLVGSSSGFSDI